MQYGKLITVRPDGTRKEARLSHKPTLEELQAEVGGYIERVRVRIEGRVRDAFVNEDGIAENLPVNRPAMGLLAPPFDANVNVLLGNLVAWVPDPKPKKETT